MLTCFVILYNIHTSLSQVAAADRTGQGSHGGILVVGYEEWQERQPSNLLSLMRHEYRRISLGAVWGSCGVKSLLVSNYAGFWDHLWLPLNCPDPKLLSQVIAHPPNRRSDTCLEEPKIQSPKVDDSKTISSTNDLHA
jgi:hypothetical protein